MLQKPQIMKTDAQPAAVIRLTIPREEIQRVMGPSYQELLSTIEAQGIKPAGPWFSHHLKLDPKVFDFEIGVPVTEPVKPKGRVKAGQLPAAKVVRTIYRGDYDGLPRAWGEFENWIKNEGLETAADLWEVYSKGPESGPDSSQWETQLNRPLAG